MTETNINLSMEVLRLLRQPRLVVSRKPSRLCVRVSNASNSSNSSSTPKPNSRVRDPFVSKIEDFISNVNAQRYPLERVRSKRLNELATIIRTVAVEEVKWINGLNSKKSTDAVASVAEVISPEELHADPSPDDDGNGHGNGREDTVHRHHSFR